MYDMGKLLIKSLSLTLLHSDRPKLYTISAVLSAIGLILYFIELELHYKIKPYLEILSRWTEYCSELYSHESCGDNAVLDCSHPPEDLNSILRKEIEISSSITERG